VLPRLSMQQAVVVVRHSQRGEGAAQQAGRGEVGRGALPRPLGTAGAAAATAAAAAAA
jgi:hypothetical protein